MAIAEMDGVSAEGQRLADVAVRRVRQAAATSPDILDGSDVRSAFWTDVEDVLGALPSVPRDKAGALHDWARELIQKLLQHVETFIDIDDGTRAERQIAFEIQDLLTGDLQDIASSKTSEEMEERAKVAVESIENTARVVKSASGEVGGLKLYSYFQAYANAQHKSANIFRGATIVLIVAAGVSSFALPHPTVAEWPALVVRLTSIAAIVGLAAYCGRQATGHRRIADWARALEVQLQSLPAFVDAIQGDSQRDAIYAAFAGRILGSPPDLKAGPSEGSEMPLAQMIDFLSAMMRKV
ncbi:hypothetical protein [Clavibacter tessellarius]|uniref:hypothetical protein n=1 Tax=Clavibacter tessellarius TaxID=31965 RepID=UPI0010423EC3|nr:hypothetical protein [Clavibacter michiganensis]